MQYQQDLVDQRCNFGKKRLARILLLFAHFDGQTAKDAVIPNIDHETLVEMVGTTRSRVRFHEALPAIRLHRLQTLHSADTNPSFSDCLPCRT